MAASRTDRPERWTQSTLKSRGWTPSLIRRFLDPPDATAPNPHYHSVAAPMKLYDVERVQALEQTPDVVEALRQARARSLKAQDRAARQRQAMLDTVRQWTIAVPQMPFDRLRTKAINHYNTLWILRGRDDKWASEDSDAAFLDRITVNYLRHSCTPYEKRLDDVYGRVGAGEARPLLKSRILMAIAATYPDLTAECDRQARRLTDQKEFL